MISTMLSSHHILEVCMCLACVTSAVATTTATTTTTRSLQSSGVPEYTPTTDVKPLGAIAADHQSLVGRLALGNQDGLDQARDIYNNGVYAESVATLTLANGNKVAQTLEVGTLVTGENVAGQEIQGTIYERASIGDETILISYKTPNDIVKSICSAGASPIPNKQNCFEPSGSVKIDVNGDGSFVSQLEYDYNSDTATSNEISLYKWSTLPSGASASEFYANYVNYYGTPDYADEFITSAFFRQQLHYELSESGIDAGEFDFSTLSENSEGIHEAIDLGTLLLTIWMEIHRKMDEAHLACNLFCIEGVPTEIPSWDQAVALYGGLTPEGSLGTSQLYLLADVTAKKYGTLTVSGDAQVNQEIYFLFNKGKEEILNCNCDENKEVIDKIAAQMAIPLIQALLFHSYEIDLFQDNKEKTFGEVLTYRNALLPLIDQCSEPNANLIAENALNSYEVTKGALERQYECLKITCAQVGGILDPVTGDYRINAQPCGAVAPTTAPVASPTAAPNNSNNNRNKDISPQDERNVLLILLLSFVGLIILAIIACCICREPNKKEFDTDAATNGDAAAVPDASDLDLEMT